MSYYVKAKNKRYDATEAAVLFGPVKVIVSAILFLVVSVVAVPLVLAAIFNIPVLPLFILIVVNFLLGRAYLSVVRSVARRYLLEKKNL